MSVKQKNASSPAETSASLSSKPADKVNVPDISGVVSKAKKLKQEKAMAVQAAESWLNDMARYMAQTRRRPPENMVLGKNRLVTTYSDYDRSYHMMVVTGNDVLARKDIPESMMSSQDTQDLIRQTREHRLSQKHDQELRQKRGGMMCFCGDPSCGIGPFFYTSK